MLGFVSKKKLAKVINELYWYHDTDKVNGTTTGDNIKDYYYNCGCANVCNYICKKFKLAKPSLSKSKK